MVRSEFMKMWGARRKAELHKMYKGQPYGEACLVAALVDLDQQAQKLWRKHRAILRHTTVEQFGAVLAAACTDRGGETLFENKTHSQQCQLRYMPAAEAHAQDYGCTCPIVARATEVNNVSK
jgi:hypothetical protein